MSRVEPLAVGTWLRKKSLAKVAEHVAYEDEQTRHICIGPVNKVVNMLVRFFHEGPQSEGFRRHIPRLQDYLWVAEGERLEKKGERNGDGERGKERKRKEKREEGPQHEEKTLNLKTKKMI